METTTLLENPGIETTVPANARAQPGIAFYDETHLSRREDRLKEAESWRGTAPRLVTDLCSAATAAEREALVRGTLEAIGFKWLSYGSVVYLGGEIIPRSFFTTYANPAWTERYFHERYYEIDQRHHESPCPGLPTVWDLNDLRDQDSRRASPGRKARFERDLVDAGIGCGVFFSLASPRHPNERTVISLMASAPDRRWINDSIVGQAMTLGLCVHEFQARYANVAAPASDRGNQLSPLQQDILDCLVRGLSDKAIAYRLNLTSYNVDYHLRQLRRRFGARNRVQLVSAAIAASLGR